MSKFRYNMTPKERRIAAYKHSKLHGKHGGSARYAM